MDRLSGVVSKRVDKINEGIYVIGAAIIKLKEIDGDETTLYSLTFVKTTILRSPKQTVSGKIGSWVYFIENFFNSNNNWVGESTFLSF